MNDELDGMLDEALASYAVQEPRAGLAGRVMARVRLDGAVSRRWWLPLAVAAALASIAIAMVMWRSGTDRRTMAVSKVAPAMVQREVPAYQDAAREESRPGRLTPAPPKRERFPSPAPLSREERALVAFAQQAPEEALKLARPDKPLEIEAIDIRPLQIDGLEIGEIR